MKADGLWAADPHEYGPGKVHIVDPDDGERTMCGKWLKAIPGKAPKGGKATCKICLNAVPNREHRQIMHEQWKADAELREAERQARAAERRAQYSAYLRSPEWLRRREKVMRRSRGVCEACLERRATQVHHVTYEHVFNEPCFDLRAVCDECHSSIHRDPGQPERLS